MGIFSRCRSRCFERIFRSLLVTSLCRHVSCRTLRGLWEGEPDLGSLLDHQQRDRHHQSIVNKKPLADAAFVPPSSWDKLVPVEVDGNITGRASDSSSQTGSSSTSKVRPRIVGGRDSELPSYAMHLTTDPDTQEWKFAGCGGTLISNCHILTSAHCVSYPRSDYSEAVYVNAWRPFQNNTDGITAKPFHVSRILPQLTVVHERFSNRDNFNDVAILTMETCTDDFEVMELADVSFVQNYPIETGVEMRVVGFGRTSIQDPTVPDTLQSVEVNYISNVDCDRDHYPSQLKQDMFCAGSVEGGRDSCTGDSGSPLFLEDPISGMIKQLGLVSWGISCASADYPGVYTSVAYHYEWIKNIVCRYGLTNRENLSLCAQTAKNAFFVDTPEMANETEVDRSEFCLDVGQLCGLENTMECCYGLVCHHRDGICAVPSRDDEGNKIGADRSHH